MLQQIEQPGTVSLCKDVMESAELDDRSGPVTEMIEIGQAHTIDACGNAIAPLAPDQPADVE